jgi:hypothetical protein
MIMLILNYALGYADETDKTVGPPVLFWACYSWIPLWGVVCSLLYLSRSQFGRKKQTTSSGRFLSVDQYLRSPLIGPPGGINSNAGSENGTSPSRSALVHSHHFTRDIMGASNTYDDQATPDQSTNHSFGRFYGELAFDHQDTMTTDTENDTEEGYNTGKLRGENGMISPDDSISYLYRDTTATHVLPSDLQFSNIIRNHPNALFQQHHDFSYRGEEEHNGQYR